MNIPHKQDNKKEQIHNLLEKGQSLENLQQWQNAIDIYKQILDINAKHIGAYIKIGNVYKKLSQNDEAVDAYQKAIDIKPDLPAVVYKNLADLLTQKGDLEKAATVYQKTITKLNNHSIKSIDSLREDEIENVEKDSSLIAKNTINLEIEKYKNILKNNPKNIKAWQILSEIYEEKQDLVQAFEAYKEVINIRHDYPGVYVKVGNILYEKNCMDEAIEAYTKAIELNPDLSFWIYIKLGDALNKQGKVDEAILNYKKAIEKNAHLPARIYVNLADILSSKNCNDEAIYYYQKSLLLKPELGAGIYFRLANAQFKQGQLDEAILNYKKVIELKPDLLVAYKKLGNSLQQQKRFDEAKLLYLQITKLNINVGEALYTQLGDVLLQGGYTEEAISSYIKGIQEQPDLIEIHKKLNPLLRRCSLEPQLLKKLLICYKEVIEKQPDLHFAYVNLGEIMTQLGNLNEAITYYQQASYTQIVNFYPDLVNTKDSWTDKGKPDFLIIGVMKCGTTSLYDYIAQHPQVLPAIQKEIHFFNKKKDLGLDWYLAHFPQISASSGFLTGEASPSYIHSNIQEYVINNFPKIKILMIIRNPVNRAISHFNHNLKVGLEKRSFEEAISCELELLEELNGLSLDEGYYKLFLTLKQWRWKEKPGYLLMGLYVYFIKKWFSFFPEQQILIIKSEDLYKNTERTMFQVFKFLGIAECQLSSYENSNPGYYSPVSEPTKKTIANFYEGFNDKLESYLNRDFGWK